MLLALDAIGILGTMIAMGTYFCVTTGRLKAPSRPYFAINIMASLCVGLSLISQFNPAGFLMQIFYGFLSIWGLWRTYTKATVATSSLRPGD